MLVNQSRLRKSLVFRAVAKPFRRAGAAGMSGAGGAGCGLETAAGPGRAALPQEPLLPRTGVTTGDVDVSLAEDIFQKPF